MVSIIVIIMIIMSIPSILLIIIIIIFIIFVFIFQNDSLEIFVFITGSFLWIAISIVVIVVFIIKPTELVEQVNILGIFDSEAFSIGKLSKYLKSLRIWKMITLHFVGYSWYKFIILNGFKYWLNLIKQHFSIKIE